MEGPVVGFILAALAGLLLTVLTFYFARKSGLQPAQTQLIITLKDTVDAQQDKVAILEDELGKAKRDRALLEERIKHLESAVIDLAAENAELRQKLGALPKRT